MRSATLFSVVAALAAVGVEAQSNTVPVTGVLGNASVVSNNPIGPTYVATMPERQSFNPADPRGNVKGSISATAGPNGVGVAFTLNLSNLPTSGGPFMYHLHVAPVNSSGSCASTLAHLDPTIRGEVPICNPASPETCQTGDLSGKYGKITSDPFTVSYVDPYASILPGIGAFFGNRSVVVHFPNATRITCANFVRVNGTQPNATTPTTTRPPPQFTGAAAGVAGSLVMVGGAFAAALLL